jgi:cytoskeletal protein CcmA (bactofilin family)
LNQNNHTLISRATKVIGDLHFTGELQLEGKVTGNIIAEDEKDAKVVIADTGVVEGEIRAPVVIVNGKVQGNIYSSKHLELAAKGNVTGTVHYHSIEMVKGAQVNGSMINKQQESASVLDIAVAKA